MTYSHLEDMSLRCLDCRNAVPSTLMRGRLWRKTEPPSLKAIPALFVKVQ